MFQVLIRAAAVAVVALVLAGCAALNLFVDSFAPLTPGEIASWDAYHDGLDLGEIKGRARVTGENYREDPQVAARRDSDPVFAEGYEIGLSSGFSAQIYREGVELGRRATVPHWPPVVVVDSSPFQEVSLVSISRRTRRQLAKAVGIAPTDWRLVDDTFLRGIYSGLRIAHDSHREAYSMGGPDAAGDAGDAGGD